MRRCFISLMLCVMMLGVVLKTDSQAQVIVSIPNSEGLRDSTVLIPIYLDLKSYTVISYYFEVNYNPAVVEIKEVDVAGTLSEVWPTEPTVNPNFAGKLIVGAFSTGDTIKGAGSLVNLKCVVKGDVGDTTNIRFGTFVLNNGTPVVYRRGAVFTVADLPSNVGERRTMAAPMNFVLHANYPDPFRYQTRISYQLNRADRVTITIFNALGQEILSLAEGEHRPDNYIVQWDGRDKYGNLCRSGLYYCQMRTSREILTEKMMLVQ